ncbi:hypothetical protein T459_07876 [Capsicum annuum]|uniref:Jacalin-type lectin domain-containing protein n=1 Tax=Capsicum annuum TaxID=4072 RepID=A0A2G2ZUW5_CAPAN|nr:inactive protein RESTRICTED TEV MOVEMENT 1 [Capsicum annuum]XP_016566580.2 inactive protein RESTRICTED TEV MOVEMENT 1 [Capsicum annuum]XP_047265101.1 inactive protein RESTRICTED TEV MOVEMENT 1 [Capsicum annuum]PHT85770.1 hypothetical protein T459_07876 [Capsicum annuum]
MNMVKVGPAGGSGGTIWDEKGRDQVAGIVVTYNEYAVHALQFLFYENGNLVLSNKHGDHRCENFRAVLFDYSSEFITSISGCFRTSYDFTKLKCISFGTNKGSYGPFGSTATSNVDTDFNFQLGNHRLFGGFHGSKTEYGVESIGIYVKPIMKDPQVKDEKDLLPPTYEDQLESSWT